MLNNVTCFHELQIELKFCASCTEGDRRRTLLAAETITLSQRELCDRQITKRLDTLVALSQAIVSAEHHST